MKRPEIWNSSLSNVTLNKNSEVCGCKMYTIYKKTQKIINFIIKKFITFLLKFKF